MEPDASQLRFPTLGEKKNGTMVLQLSSAVREKIDKYFKRAISIGGTVSFSMFIMN